MSHQTIDITFQGGTASTERNKPKSILAVNMDYNYYNYRYNQKLMEKYNYVAFASAW